MKTKNFSKEFWIKFQQSVIERNAKKTAKLSYFYSDDDKDYFLDTYESVFDDAVVNAIKESDYKDIQKVSKNSISEEINPFDMLLFPDEVNEVFILKIACANDEEFDDSYIADKFSPVNFHDEFYEEHELDYSENNFDDFDIDLNDDVTNIKVFVFAYIKNELKFMGTYNIE
jgi:hypothetical protein